MILDICCTRAHRWPAGLLVPWILTVMLMRDPAGPETWILNVLDQPVMPGIPGPQHDNVGGRFYNLKILGIRRTKIFP